MTSSPFGSELLAHAWTGERASGSPILHQREIAARAAILDTWRNWVPSPVIRIFAEAGVPTPWSHQARAADLAYQGEHVVIATGTASGKSLAYQLPIISTLLANHASTALYVAPTKALGADQIRSISRLLAGHEEFVGMQPATYDGDTPHDVRAWIRQHSRWIFTNPDMLHVAILANPGHWRPFLRNLRFVVLDECHHYRGVFGANMAWITRRLLRLARAAGANPTVIGASATVGEPGASLSRLIGEPVHEIADDGSPHGGRTVALCEPSFIPGVVGVNDAPVRRSSTSEAAQMLAALVTEGARTLCFVRSRRGVETVALQARQILEQSAPHLAGRVAAYRAGYLADDRRALERDLSDGTLLGVATTNALELGIDVAGLDAIIIAGYPGTVASFWQQAGRAGRRGDGSLVVLISRDDPLDTYLVNNPAALLDKPVESTVIDPTNPYLMHPHLLCAAAERRIDPEEAAALGVSDSLAELTAQGLLRRRPAGWYIAAGVEPHADIDVRGGIGEQLMVVDHTTGRLLGTVDTGRVFSSMHPGAVHIHQGDTYVVDEIDLDDGIVLLHPEVPNYTTDVRQNTDITITNTLESQSFSGVTAMFCEVEVTRQVVGYLRRSLDGEVLDSVPLDLPAHTLPTRAVVYTITPELLESHTFDGPIPDDEWPGALHAAEHAAIGMLPLLATCDRWDIGGVSTAGHADTGLPTVFVYDGYPGGAGFAERGYHRFTEWIRATLDAITSCGCPSGCPSCVQSPKCGNGNEPLDKSGAVGVLRRIEDAHLAPR